MTQVVDTLLRPTLTVYDPEETGEPIILYTLRMEC